MRRISIWGGLGLMFLALLAIASWGASTGLASYKVEAPKAASQQTSDSYQPPNLSGVPLRNNWWGNIPNIDPATKMNQSLLAGWQSNQNAEQGFMVYLKAQADTGNTITDWNAKGEYVLHHLESVANATQPGLMQAVSALQASRWTRTGPGAPR